MKKKNDTNILVEALRFAPDGATKEKLHVKLMERVLQI